MYMVCFAVYKYGYSICILDVSSQERSGWCLDMDTLSTLVALCRGDHRWIPRTGHQQSRLCLLLLLYTWTSCYVNSRTAIDSICSSSHKLFILYVTSCRINDVILWLMSKIRFYLTVWLIIKNMSPIPHNDKPGYFFHGIHGKYTSVILKIL